MKKEPNLVKKTGFYLTEYYITTLRRIVRKTGLRQSELVRKALDLLFREYGEQGPRDEVDNTLRKKAG